MGALGFFLLVTFHKATYPVLVAEAPASGAASILPGAHQRDGPVHELALLLLLPDEVGEQLAVHLLRCRMGLVCFKEGNHGTCRNIVPSEAIPDMRFLPALQRERTVFFYRTTRFLQKLLRGSKILRNDGFLPVQ